MTTQKECNPADTESNRVHADVREGLMRRATYAATTVAGVLIVIKLVAWWYTDSVALLSTLIDSVLDAGASVVNLFAVRHALQPADDDHRFGHGKAEPLAGLAQSAFIAGAAVLLLIESFGRLYNPVVVQHEEIGIAVMVVSIFFTMALVAYQKRVIAQTASVAISADSLHYAGDVLINAAVIISICVGMWFGWAWLDPVFAAGIAAFLLYNAFEIAKVSLDLLMDKEFPDADRKLIYETCMAVEGVLGAHDLRTRSSGQDRFIQIHVEMAPHLPLWHAHKISDRVEKEILAKFPDADVIIHQDPKGLQEDHPDLVYEAFTTNSTDAP